MKVLVVGAGFAGAVTARTLADAGQKVVVIDQRGHIAGNAYDFVDKNGVRVHAYGPHLFHTNNETVVDWLKRFGAFCRYEHSVSVKVGASFVPLPVSRGTYEVRRGQKFASQAEFRQFLRSVVRPTNSVTTAADHLYSTVGQDIADLIFRTYTRKMWEKTLEEMDADVVRRIAVTPHYEHRYFPNDRFQLLPSQGYTALFEHILNHKNIDVLLDTRFTHAMRDRFDYTFSSAPIDEHYGYCFGELPYRSIKFHHRSERSVARSQPTPVVNFSDQSPFTRETCWHMFPGHRVSSTGFDTFTLEEPCDFKLNGLERYYPVNDAKGQSALLYNRYRSLAAKEDKLSFIGRCGTYQYLDMHQVINQSLQGAQRWLTARDLSGVQSDRGCRLAEEPA